MATVALVEPIRTPYKDSFICRDAAGDFGTIERATGEFVREGNIYTHPATALLATPHPQTTAAAVDVYIVSTFHVRKRDFTVGASVEVAGLADATVKAQFDFDSKRAALLAMHRPRTTRVPPEFLRAAIDTAAPALQGKVLVTEVLACPAFVLYLSNKAGEMLRLALRETVPVPTAAGLSAGPEIEVGWWTDGGTDVLQQAYSAEYNFYPLFQLKTMRKPSVWDIRRDGEVHERDPEALRANDGCKWLDAETPWESLDSDGEEVEDPTYESGSEDDDS